MRIYPAPHYTMGGLWVDYDLMSTVPGLFVIGEANFSDHGANRLGASALMQGLCDGYFVLPYTIGDYLARVGPKFPDGNHPACTQVLNDVRQRIERVLAVGGKRSVDSFHRELGDLMWDQVGMARNATGLRATLEQIPALRDRFWNEVAVVGTGDSFNNCLERALRVADFLEFGELLCRDALVREESCGGHFREEYQTAEGEALRDDENYCHVAAWEWQGEGEAPVRHEEPLAFETVALATRSYK
jgi:succinate dehydrogenase / fumarate reductase flavoprotein subunit